MLLRRPVSGRRELEDCGAGREADFGGESVGFFCRVLLDDDDDDDNFAVDACKIGWRGTDWGSLDFASRTEDSIRRDN